MYQLKLGSESFTVVDGPYAGKTYKPGQAYADVPPQEMGRFRKIKEEAPDSGTGFKQIRAEATKAKTNEGAAALAPENGEVK
ncbi:MAG: hypothetical protein M0P16_00490 [Syntrophales bacterium]|nr:hypothetical protein [Syntrophales bacterium]MCK9390264.1 hypothetical protein [Syntrophales bacterium]